MKALLIYPEIPDTFWSFNHALSFIHKKASYPPLGLLTLAAMLPEQWEVRLVDTNITKLTDEDIAWADTAFISAMAVQRQTAQQIALRLKKAGVTVVAGGPLFTAECERFEGVDHFVLNEAELTLSGFLKDFARGEAQPLYATDEFADIRQTPAPVWRLAQLKSYAMMCIQFSRGCPFDCDFCNVTALLGRQARTKDAQQIIAELDSLYSLGWRRDVFFVDDNLIGNKKQLRTELLPALIDWRRDKTGIGFTTEVSINVADDESLMQKMVEAGFNAVFIGIETPNEDSLAECSKKQNLNRDLISDVKRVQRAGLQVHGGFIVGFDNDTPSTFERLTQFIQGSGIVTAMVGLLQAPPGTKLYERLSKNGRLLEQMSGDNGDGSTNIIPIMKLETLQAGYRNLLQHIYAPEAYYQRVKTFLREYKLPKIRTGWNFKLTMESLMALLRSIGRLGVANKYRLQYWKLFIWALLHKPRAFPLAITLAIYGYHFRKISELSLP